MDLWHNFNNRNAQKRTMIPCEEKDLKKICNHELLSAEEEQTLGTLAHAGDQKAIDKLVKHNMRLVAHLAKHFVTNRVTMMDAISIGVMGLIKAAHRYDPKRGNKFSTYATWWIRDALLDAFWRQKSALIHIPTSMSDVERKVSRGQEITNAERLRLEQVEAARAAYSNVYGLEGKDEPQAPEDLDDSDSELIQLMMEKLGQLSAYDRYILKARFGIAPNVRKMTLAELGTVEGLSQERIRQIEQRAMERLRALILESSDHVPGLSDKQDQ
jgi:RNA polymerase primary sigma factor